MSYLAFPKGYEPEIAAGPPSTLHLAAGCSWTENDTLEMQKLESAATIQEHKPAPGIWYQKLEEK